MFYKKQRTYLGLIILHTAAIMLSMNKVVHTPSNIEVKIIASACNEYGNEHKQQPSMPSSGVDSALAMFKHRRCLENLTRLSGGMPTISYGALHYYEVDGNRYLVTYTDPQETRNKLIIEYDKKQKVTRWTKIKIGISSASATGLAILLPLILSDNGSLMNIKFDTFLTQWNLLFLTPVIYGLLKIPLSLARNCKVYHTLENELLSLDSQIEHLAYTHKVFLVEDVEDLSQVQSITAVKK